MKATITLQQLWFNATLLDFFFRQQAKETLEELIQQVGADSSRDNFYEFSERVEDFYDGDLDAFEEDCYDKEAAEIAIMLGYDEEK